MHSAKSRLPNTPAQACGSFTIKGACSWSGMSRSAIYREAAAGRLILRKLGRSTLVDAASLAELLNSLPRAELGRKAG
jgi:hypothetical protein